MNTFNKIAVGSLLTLALLGSGYAFHLMMGPIGNMQRSIASSKGLVK